MAADSGTFSTRPASPPDAMVIQTAPGRFEVRGALTFATARRAREAGERCLVAVTEGEGEMSCRGVTAADSAGLAVLLDWLAFARRRGCTLRFSELPDELRAVARISEVEDLLGITPEDPRR